MTFVFYKVDYYGRETVIAKSDESEELEQAKNKLFEKKVFIPTLLVMLGVVFVGIVIGLLSPTSCVYGSDRGCGVIMGFTISLLISMFVFIVGVGGSLVNFHSKYKIEWRGKL